MFFPYQERYPEFFTISATTGTAGEKACFLSGISVSAAQNGVELTERSCKSKVSILVAYRVPLESGNNISPHSWCNPVLVSPSGTYFKARSAIKYETNGYPTAMSETTHTSRQSFQCTVQSEQQFCHGCVSSR